MKKRFLSLFISLTLIVSLVPFASAERFADVNNDTTARNIAVLRLMGVISGDTDGNFRPNDKLTRAEFCKMTVMLMDKGSDAVLFKNRTIFPDVPTSHWAVGYINYAAASSDNTETTSYSSSTENGTTTSRISTSSGGALLHGQPDGTFAPNRAISFAEAVTILMRLIGYSEGNVDMQWPQGYLDMAAEKKLTKGLSLSANDSINRAQAAQLFVNALNTEVYGLDAEYVTTLGTVSGEVTILSVNYATGKVITTEPTSEGTSYQSTHEYTSTTDADGNIQIQSKSESQYSSNYSTIGGSRTEYKFDELVDLSEFIGLKGKIVMKKGKLLTFLPSTSDTGAIFTDAAIILAADGSTAGFDALTGGAKNYKVFRNGARATVSDLRKYDVVTYDSKKNSLYACDTRVQVYYENCAPTPSAPTSITVLDGTSFVVLPTAQQSLSRYKPGDKMVILLTADGRVAGAADNGGTFGMQANAIASVDKNGKVSLICGRTLIELQCSGKTCENEIVRLTQFGKISEGDEGRINAGATLTPQHGMSSDKLDVKAEKVGARTVASDALIFLEGKTVTLKDLYDAGTFSIGVEYLRTNHNGELDVISLKSITMEYYGRLSMGSGERATYNVDCGGKKTWTGWTVTEAKSGDFVALRVNDKGDSVVFTNLEKLTKVADVPASAWIGKTSVLVNGLSYEVPENVLCCNKGGGWFEDLDEALAYGGSMNLYVKDGVVRIIEMKN